MKLAKRKSWKVRMDPGQDPTASFFQGWLLSVLLTSGALSDPVPIDTVVQHWLLAIDRDRIAVGLLLCVKRENSSRMEKVLATNNRNKELFFDIFHVDVILQLSWFVQ